MLLTVCMNPSFDRTATIDHLVPGETNRLLSARTDPGGKGINVARGLLRLGDRVCCLTAAGKDGCERLDRMLRPEGLPLEMIPVSGAVRTNLKVMDAAGTLTELNEAGPVLTPEDVSRCMDALQQVAHEAEYTVLTGSLPGGCGKDLYADMMRCLPAGSCLLDAEGETLLNGLREQPLLVKPNREELSRTLGVNLPDRAAIRKAAEKLLDMGAQNVLVSLGKDGAMLVSPGMTLSAEAVPVKVQSSVGAGDAMLACFLHGLKETGSLREAFRWGVAGGTCSVMSAGTNLFRKEDIDPMLKRVVIREEMCTGS